MYQLFNNLSIQEDIISEISDYVHQISNSGESAEVTIATRNLVTKTILESYINYSFYNGLNFSIVKKNVQEILNTFNELHVFDIQTIWNELLLYMRNLYNEKSKSFKQHLLQRLDKNIKPSLTTKTIDNKTFQETFKQILGLIEKHVIKN